MGDSQNLQYTDQSKFFGGNGAAYASTGAPGTEGITAAESAGPVVGSPVISAPFGSSQVPANMAHVDVVSGDTSAFSSDRPVNPGPLLPDWQGASVTGAGSGSPHDRHPNAVTVPSLAAQAENARRPS